MRILRGAAYDDGDHLEGWTHTDSVTGIGLV